MSEHLTIDDCMSPGPYTIDVELPASQAKKLMSEHAIRHLPVVEGERLVGIISVRDLYIMQAEKVEGLETVRVRALMKDDPYCVQVGTSLRDVAINMNAHKYGCTVVKDGEKIVGLFTTVDAMRVLANVIA
ncbi:MAG: CBS domain-containing protein [Myxococcales bacterium]|nr:CBS domain-containing protein [Myxococcales bacterium]